MNSCSTYTRFSWLDILQTNHPYKKKQAERSYKSIPPAWSDVKTADNLHVN